MFSTKLSYPMKKLLIVIAALTAAVSANAQESSSRLPQKGDIATGVDLVGMIRFVGNTMSSKTEGEAVAPFNGDFFVKYFVSDRIALRAHLGLGVENSMRRELVRDDEAYARDNASVAKKQDEERHRARNFSLGAGVEFRKGLRRVQGYAGAELFVATGSDKYEFRHGNRITENNLNPTTALGVNTSYPYGPIERYLERSGRSISGGMALFTGVDYFISRSVSLGFEFSLSARGTTVKPYKSVSERRVPTPKDGASNYQQFEETRPQQKSFTLAPVGGANMMFYF